MHESSSGVLIALALLMTGPPSTGGSGAKKKGAFPPQRVGPFVDRDLRVGWHKGSQLRGEKFHALVEIEIDGAMHVVGGNVCDQRIVFSHRREQVGLFIIDEHDGYRLFEVGPA